MLKASEKAVLSNTKLPYSEIAGKNVNELRIKKLDEIIKRGLREDQKLPTVFFQNPKTLPVQYIDNDVLIEALIHLNIDVDSVESWRKHQFGVIVLFKPELRAIINKILLTTQYIIF